MARVLGTMWMLGVVPVVMAFVMSMARARATGEQAGTVTVIVSHRFSTIAGADLILVMDDGRLVESGTHDELLAADGRYADLYNIQSAAYAP